MAPSLGDLEGDLVRCDDGLDHPIKSGDDGVEGTRSCVGAEGPLTRPAADLSPRGRGKKGRGEKETGKER